jgi:hypothetical protein
LYSHGSGVLKNDIEAARWYQESADQDHPSAQYFLGLLYAGGIGVPQDDDEAVRLLRMAALQGHADAQNALGEMHQYGHGVHMYQYGKGVPIDAAEAARWYWLAVWQGHADACLNLGILMSLPQAAAALPQRTITSYIIKDVPSHSVSLKQQTTNADQDPLAFPSPHVESPAPIIRPSVAIGTTSPSVASKRTAAKTVPLTCFKSRARCGAAFIAFGRVRAVFARFIHAVDCRLNRFDLSDDETRPIIDEFIRLLEAKGFDVLEHHREGSASAPGAFALGASRLIETTVQGDSRERSS